MKQDEKQGVVHLVSDDRSDLYAVRGNETLCHFGDVAEMAGAERVLKALGFEVRTVEHRLADFRPAEGR